MEKITILVADDHALVRESICELLGREDDLYVVGEAGDGEEAVRLATELRPDVAIMDIAMPKLNGIEATMQIKALCPTTAVLILSAYDDDAYIFALLEAGAAGCLLENVRGHDLIEAIRAVRAGESVLHPAIVPKVIDRFAHPPGELPEERALDQLTERELEVLKLAAKGMSNEDIAYHLSLSVCTVQAHLSTVFSKMQVGSRTEAMVQALQKGWLPLGDTPSRGTNTVLGKGERKMLVGERMTRDPIIVRDDTPIDKALKIMRDNKIRRLPVLNDKGALVGIVSERDLLFASPSPVTSLSIYELHYLMSRIQVADVMTTKVMTVAEDTSLKEAARIMADNRIGGLPVERKGELVGIITETDLFKIFLELLEAQEVGGI